MGKFLWLMITQDKYELPLVVADTAKELAMITGTTKNNVVSSACRYRRDGWGTKFVRVKLEEDFNGFD